MASYQHISHGFDPVFDEHSRVLVLGSFPSVLSRANAFYYGNPQNRFWRVIAHSLGQAGCRPTKASPCPRTAAQHRLRSRLPRRRRFSSRAASRCGMPSRNATSRGPRTRASKTSYPRISSASPSARISRPSSATAPRRPPLQALPAVEGRLVAHVLPSTSPANAAWKTERLIERWGNELRAIADELAEVDRQRETAADEGATEEPHRSRAKGSATVRTRKSGAVSYGTIRIDAPAASNFAVHKSMQETSAPTPSPSF